MTRHSKEPSPRARDESSVPASRGAGPEVVRNTRNSATVSLSTLAAHLGLSPAAISRVLNQVPAARSIPSTTQERIFAAARQFNYRPNAVARSLRHGRSMTIGVLLPEISEGYATLVLAGLESALLERGYCFFLISHHHRDDILERSHGLLLQRSVDGLVAIDTPLRNVGDLPTVTVSCPVLEMGVTNIVLHHDRAAELAVNHIAELGHRHVAVLKGESFSSDSEVRWNATKAAAIRLGLQLRTCEMGSLINDSLVHDSGYRAAQELLARGGQFTALLAFNDISAIGAIRAFREAGLRIPADVSIIGFDDIDSAAFQNPGLTTIRQPLRLMGQLAGEAVVRQIVGPRTAWREAHVTVEPELIVRGSTGPALRATKR